jgi:hypothetical protein
VSAARRPGRAELPSRGSASPQPPQHRRSLVVLDVLPVVESL